MNQALLILGGLGVFLFGLRVMSQGLQKMAGGRLRAILGSLTRNRGAGLLSGFIITAVVQSSSATTVLIVSFVNASLLNLSQAIGLVMGAKTARAKASRAESIVCMGSGPYHAVEGG